MNRNPGTTEKMGGGVFCRTAKMATMTTAFWKEWLALVRFWVQTAISSPFSQLINTSCLEVSCYFFPICISKLRTGRPWVARWLASVGRVRPWLESWALSPGLLGCLHPCGRPGLLICHQAQTFASAEIARAGFSDASSTRIKERLWQSCGLSMSSLCK